MNYIKLMTININANMYKNNYYIVILHTKIVFQRLLCTRVIVNTRNLSFNRPSVAGRVLKTSHFPYK